MNFLDFFNHIEERVKKLDFDDYEISGFDEQTLSIETKDLEVDTLEESSLCSFSLRLIKGRKVGFGYSVSKSKDSVDKLIESARISLEQAVEPFLEAFHMYPSDPHIFPNVKIMDSGITNIPIQSKIDTLKEIEKKALTYHPNIKAVRDCSYGEYLGSIVIKTKHGSRIGYRSSYATYSLGVIAEAFSDQQVVYDSLSSTFYGNLKKDHLIETVCSEAVNLLGAKPIESRKMNVVLTPKVASELLEIFSESFLANHVYHHQSILKDKVGKKIVSGLISIVDDGLYADGIGTRPFDAEGVPSQKTHVVKEGVLNTFLYDCYYAKLFEAESTSNSSRDDVEAPPEIDVTNFYIEKGSCDDVVSQVKTGLLVTDLIGSHTANEVTLDFSLGVSGFLIQDGKAKAPVKGVMMGGNLLELFSKIEHVGTDFELHEGYGSPSLHCSSVSIHGASE